MRLAALVLAAGASSRAGGVHKLLAQDRFGQRMIVRSVQSALASQVTEVIVVLGHRKDEVASALQEAGLLAQSRMHLVPAADYRDGLAASLRCGLCYAMERQAEGALVCLGDMPLVHTQTLDRLIGRLACDSTAQACVPTLGGKPGNPVLWRNSRFEALLALSGDQGGRCLLVHDQSQICEVPVDAPGIFEDFDTPARLAEYAALPLPRGILHQQRTHP